MEHNEDLECLYVGFKKRIENEVVVREAHKKQSEKEIAARLAQQKREEDILKRMAAMEIQLQQQQKGSQSNSAQPLVTKNTTAYTQATFVLHQLLYLLANFHHQFPRYIPIINMPTMILYLKLIFPIVITLP